MKTPNLLVTKFHIPPRRAGWVARPRLLEQFQRGLDENRNLTLISAPAGYGKSILVAEWIANFQSSLENLPSKISWLYFVTFFLHSRWHYFRGGLPRTSSRLNMSRSYLYIIPVIATDSMSTPQWASMNGVMRLVFR